jgi:predicted GNAT family acetyltransferase
LARLKEIEAHRYEEALDFCRTQPSQTMPIAHWICEHLGASEFARHGWLLGEFDQNQTIIGLALISETGILYPVLRTDECFAQINAITQANTGMIRVLIGQKSLVDSMWGQFHKQGFQARIDHVQALYSVDKETLQAVEGNLSLNIASEQDLDELVLASAAMAKEESGNDAQARNPGLFRERVQVRLKKKGDFIHKIEGEIAFKASVSALLDFGGQIEGVYTAPAFRRQGLARRGTAYVSQWVLARAESAFLLVNAENTPARSLYEDLGFKQLSESRTIFIDG